MGVGGGWLLSFLSVPRAALSPWKIFDYLIYKMQNEPVYAGQPGSPVGGGHLAMAAPLLAARSFGEEDVSRPGLRCIPVAAQTPCSSIRAAVRSYSCQPPSPRCYSPSCLEKERVFLISHMAWSFICRGKLKRTLLVSILHANFDIAFQEYLLKRVVASRICVITLHGGLVTLPSLTTPGISPRRLPGDIAARLL